MGNWRTVNIIGTFDPAEVEPARRYLTVDWRDDARIDDIGPLSINDGLCSLGVWVAPTVMAVGNLYERDYSVQDVADHLSKLLAWAPSMRLKVHCGDDWESARCVATVTVADGSVVVGEPEVLSIAAVADDVVAGRLFKVVLMDDPVMSEIKRLQGEIQERGERISELRKLRCHPVVIPVLHYWRFGNRSDEPYDDYAADEWDVLGRAFRHLWWMQEREHGAPDGVSVMDGNMGGG